MGVECEEVAWAPPTPDQVRDRLAEIAAEREARARQQRGKRLAEIGHALITQIYHATPDDDGWRVARVLWDDRSPVYSEAADLLSRAGWKVNYQSHIHRAGGRLEIALAPEGAEPDRVVIATEAWPELAAALDELAPTTLDLTRAARFSGDARRRALREAVLDHINRELATGPIVDELAAALEPVGVE